MVASVTDATVVLPAMLGPVMSMPGQRPAVLVQETVVLPEVVAAAEMLTGVV